MSLESDGYDYYGGLNHRILALVPENAKTMLDIGCAKGLLGEAVKNQKPGREVWGVELMPAVADEARTRLDHVLVGDIERMDPLPLPERYFDCITCGDVLEHLRDPASILTRLKNHLKRDGALLCSVPNVGHWSVLLGLLRGRFDYEDKGLLDRTHVHFFTPITIREMLWDAGYIVTHEESSDMGHPGVEAALGHLAQALGQNPETTTKAARTYQQVYATKLKPNPFEEPEKMQILVGPHVGKLGPASKRCSIVIVTYNNERDIEECLSSVLSAMSPDDEVIVWDNGSNDGTVSTVEEFVEAGSCVKLFPSDQNIGFSSAVNMCALESNGEFILSLNPDTLVWPGLVERLLGPFSDESVGATGPLSDQVAGDAFIGNYVDGWAREWVVERSHTAARTLSRGTKPTAMLMGYCLMLRRSIIDRFGALEGATSMGADDLEISWRYQELGLRLLVVTNEFVHHRGRASFSSLSRRRREEQIKASDNALIKKLFAYYGQIPSSEDIWQNGILTHAMATSII